MITTYARAEHQPVCPDFFPGEDEVTGYACSCGNQWAERVPFKTLRPSDITVTCPSCGHVEWNPR